MPIGILSSLALTLTLLSHPGPQRTSSIQGSVTVEGNVIDDPIVVYLEGSGSRPIEEALTDDAGCFAFSNVPPGTYYVRVKHEGFEEVAQRIDLPAYDRDLTILLQPKLHVPALENEIRLGTKHQVDIRQLSIPKKAVREYRKALEESRRGRTSSAIDRLQRALNMAPNFIEAAFHLGSIYYRMGRLDEAEETLKRALTIVPEAQQLRLLLEAIEK